MEEGSEPLGGGVRQGLCWPHNLVGLALTYVNSDPRTCVSLGSARDPAPATPCYGAGEVIVRYEEMMEQKHRIQARRVSRNWFGASTLRSQNIQQFIKILRSFYLP